MERRRFLATVGHEIRTPLNAILGMAELISEKTEDKQVSHYSQLIHQSGKNLLSITNDILDFSKIEAGRIELDKVPFRLDELIQDIASTFQHDVMRKGLGFFKM